MVTADNIRNSLIEKILSIKNLDFLVALDQLISTRSPNGDLDELTDEQKLMLEMSEDDIKNGRLISQKSLESKTLEWLKNQS